MTGIDADRQTARVRLARGATADLDAAYLEQGYLDYGYALTAHKAQGATVDRAYVLGSDDLYREWGYTALSRHRHEARFYLVSPASIERNLPGLEPDEDPLVERLKDMLADSRAKTLALDELPDEPRLAEEALDRFRGLLADERHATNALQRAEEELGDTRTRLEQMQDEQGGLGRIFHRHERAALSVAIEGHERALEYWQEQVDAAEAELAAAAASREGWLTEHGEPTLALLNAESAARDHGRDELRGELVARTRDGESIDLAARDAWARAEVRAVEPVAELPPPASELDVGLDLGP